MTFCSFTSQFGQFGSLVRNSRSDTRPVEPVRTFHDSVKVEIARIGFGDSRVGTVINYFARTHGSSCFQIIDTYAVAITTDEIGLHTIFTQCIHSRLSNFVFRQFSYEISFVTVVRATHRYVRFTTAINNIK